MAKKLQAGLKELPAELETITVVGASEAGEPNGPFASLDDVATLPLPRWNVSLNCPTPLAHKTLVVEAATEQEARGKFCAANGISDSRHDWKITRVE